VITQSDRIARQYATRAAACQGYTAPAGKQVTSAVLKRHWGVATEILIHAIARTADQPTPAVWTYQVDRIRKTAIFCLAGDQWSRRFVPGLWGRRRWVDADHGDTHHDWTTVALGLQAWNKDRGKAYARPTLRYRPSHKISFHARYGQVVARPPIDATQRLIASGTTEASTGCLRLAARRWRASD